MCCGGDMLNLVGERMPLGGDTMGGIKLFGQTISVTQNHTGAGADAEVRLSAGPVGNAAVTYRQEWTEIKGVVEKPISARSSSGDGYLQPPQSSKLATTEYVGSRLSDASSEGGQSEGDHSQSVGNDKNNLPKPDKVVACPRCDSFDTKFCYYNNYNVNQPRHFCKNCQRYWTAGGTLRNVPVGAGRRKNKHGGGGGGALQQRESGADASASTLFSGPLGSPPSQKGVSFKQSQPKRMAEQSSPMRSPGSVSSFGQESGITMSSPPCALQQNGRLPFEPFASSQGFMSAGIEASAVGSSDSGSTLRQRLQRFPSGHGFDKDCGRSSLSGLMQDAPNLTAFTQQQESSCRPIAASSNMTSGWAGSDGPGGSFNGEYPNGYHLEWSGKHSLAASQGVAPFSTPARSSYNPTGLTPTWGCTQWNSPFQMVAQRDALNTTLGKRGAPDGGSQMPALGLDGYSRSFKSKWPMLGRNPSDVSATMKLFQPKLESEQKDSFMVRPFLNSAAARPGSYPVTI